MKSDLLTKILVYFIKIYYYIYFYFLENFNYSVKILKYVFAYLISRLISFFPLQSVLQQTANPLPIAIADLPPSPTTHTPLPNNFLLASSNQICTVCKKNFEVDASSNPRIGQLTPENSNSVESNSSDATNAGNITVTCALANNANNGDNNQPVEIALDAAAAQTATEAAATALPSNGLKATLLPMATHQQAPVLKKQGVSGESCETSMQQSFNIPIPKFEKDFRCVPKCK